VTVHLDSWAILARLDGEEPALSRIEASIADVPARVEEREGFPVIVTDWAMAPMSVAEARAAVERTRR
jgi:hypothetical protein